MDTITQGLLGAVAAQAGFRQRIGRDASWVAAAAAISPDLDLFVPPVMRWLGLSAGPWAQALGHRGLSHSLLAVPAIALLFAIPWWLIRRRVLKGRPDPPAGKLAGFGWLYACCVAAVATHGLLDWCTAYGTQLLSPLTNTRYAINAVPIVDILYTPLLILTLLACYLVRKLRGGRAPRASLAIGLAGLILSTGYLATGYVLRGAAVERARSAAGADHVVWADAFPRLGTILVWRVVMETPEDWITARVHFMADRPPSGDDLRRTPRTPPSRWIDRARDTEAAREYEWFAGGHVRYEYEPRGTRHVVWLHDMRYAADAAGASSRWPLRVEMSNRGEVLSAERTHVSRAPEAKSRQEAFGQIARNAWREIVTP